MLNSALALFWLSISTIVVDAELFTRLLLHIMATTVTNTATVVITMAITAIDNEMVIILMITRSGDWSNPESDAMTIVLVVEVGETCDTVSACVVGLDVTSDGSSAIVIVSGTARTNK